MYLYIYVCMYIYIYIYIKRERARERERERETIARGRRVARDARLHGEDPQRLEPRLDRIYYYYY